MSTVLVTGATGYIGGRLVPALLEAGHEVRCLVRTPTKLRGIDWAERVTVVQGSLEDDGAVREAMEGCAAAYFLVHSMGGSDDFAATDRRNDRLFAEAAADTPTMERIVYLGGLGQEGEDLSPHLASR
ncbi:MAG TPA: NAD(P)H-binding protein, partial [Acidimicrobiales bacterium]|nr:NAD(P)H-binding protein [Acidimicrobiales bacterium]